jgi:flagellar basal-body rod protein FlgB
MLNLLENVIHFTNKRQKVIASNIVDIDTPDFRAKDLEFRKVFNEERLGLSNTHKRHITLETEENKNNGAMVFKTNLLWGDRNNVELDIEVAKMTENALYKDDSLYEVKKGDSLSQIVYQFLRGNESKENIYNLVDQVARENGITHPDRIIEGQKIDLSSLFRFVKDKTNHLEERTIYSQEKISSGKDLPEFGEPASAQLINMIQSISLRDGVDPVLSTAVARAESSVSESNSRRFELNPYLVNSDSKCKGLFQLLDQTGKKFHKDLVFEEEYNPFNISQNIQIGVRYLKHLEKVFLKDTVLSKNLNTTAVRLPSERKQFVIAAYNAGEGRVAMAQQMAEQKGKDPKIFKNIEAYLPKETRLYVRKVLRFQDMLV